jgi:hypothetical protein
MLWYLLDKGEFRSRELYRVIQEERVIFCVVIVSVVVREMFI